MSTSPQDPHIHREIWNANRDSWNAAMGDSGNSFYRHLVCPTALSLLNPRPNEDILELACGTGIFARKLAELGTRVVAADFSELMVAAALERGGGLEAGVEYRQADVTSVGDLEGLVREGGYDGVVCNMALMDIHTLDPLARALPGLLKRNGCFVMTIMHPAFNSPGTQRYVSVGEDPITGRVGSHYGVNVARYLSIPPAKGEAIPGQAKAQYYFHRPLQEILGVFFKHGLVVDGMEEPAFSGEASGSELGWENYSQIPPVLGVRFRKLGTDQFAI